MTWRDRSSRWAVVAVLALALVGCAAPAPAPGRPTPVIPDDVTLYDTVPVVPRPAVIAQDCRQFSQAVLDRLGMEDPRNEGEGGCNLRLVEDAPFATPFDTLTVTPASVLPDEPPDYFQQIWNFTDVSSQTNDYEYYRRLVLGGRYYAIERYRHSVAPSCELVVADGSPKALMFFSAQDLYRTDAVQQEYGDLESYDPGWDNRAGLRRWVQDTCPTVERKALDVLAVIDPGGGTLATP